MKLVINQKAEIFIFFHYCTHEKKCHSSKGDGSKVICSHHATMMLGCELLCIAMFVTRVYSYLSLACVVP